MTTGDLKEQCPRCKGTGIEYDAEGDPITCRFCDGKGYYVRDKVESKEDEIDAEVDAMQIDVTDIKDKVNDIKEKCDEIWDKVKDL